MRFAMQSSRLEKREKGIESVERASDEKDARKRDTTDGQGDGKRKWNRYVCRLARADGRRATRFGRRIQIGGKRGNQQARCSAVDRDESGKIARMDGESGARSVHSECKNRGDEMR